MRRYIAWAMAGLVSAIILAYLATSYLVYDKLSRITPGGGEDQGNTPNSFRGTFDKWIPFDESPYFMPVYESVNFPSRQPGINLTGWYIPGEIDAPAVLLTHGLNGCKCQANILTAAGMLHRAGFNVLVYDLREHGDSDIEDGRGAVGNDEYLDLLGAWDWLVHEKGFAEERIGAYGQSYGAATTLIAFTEEPRLAAAFVDSPYADLRAILEEELARNGLPLFVADGAVLAARLVAGDDLLAHNPSRALAQAGSRPVYIVHGTDDHRIDVHHTRDLAALAAQTGANVTIWLVEDVEHVEAELEFPLEYERRVSLFFHQALEW